MTWRYYNHALLPDTAPHEKAEIHDIPWKMGGGYAILARYTEDFDCDRETEWWHCIKDTPFHIEKVKAKRRYEIKRGIKNFETKIIEPDQYTDALYQVYCKSLDGYSPYVRVGFEVSQEDFKKRVNNWGKTENCLLFGTFEKGTGMLCGFSDIYIKGRLLSMSSLKTRTDKEKAGVNFSLIYEIVTYFEKELCNGCYLHDGERNILHQTHFQDFLIKYFGFRRAYCKLVIRYRWWVKILVNVLYPVRRLFENRKLLLLRRVQGILFQEEIRRSF